MIILNIVKCLLYPHYHSLYVASTSDELEELFIKCKEIIKCCPIFNEIQIRHSIGHFYFLFPNGSILEGMIVNPTIRGKRANCICYDDAIDESIVDSALKPMLRKYSKEEPNDIRRDT